MQPSEEDQSQSVVLASHSGLGFVAVHVGKVSVKLQQNFLQLSAVKQHNLIRTINPSSIFDLNTRSIDIYL